MPIKVLVVDDRAVIRAGIRQVCAVDDGIEVVGEARSWNEARQIAVSNPPDVLVIDLHQAGGNGVEVISKIRAKFSTLQILVFTDTEEWDDATRLVALGARGYLAKAATLNEIAVGIRCVHAGRIFISHSDTGIPAPNLISPTAALSKPDLSERETEVITLLADGLTNKQIAEQLFLSVKTIETYRARIMKKHDLKDRAAMVRFARELEALPVMS